MNNFIETWPLPYFKIYQPSVQLSDLVKEIQVYHINWREEDGLPPPFITCLANTEQNLYFFLNDQTRAIPAEKVEIPVPPVIVTGPKYKPSGLLFGQNHLMIKVLFHPTGSYRLLGIDMQKTVNSGVDAAHAMRLYRLLASAERIQRICWISSQPFLPAADQRIQRISYRLRMSFFYQSIELPLATFVSSWKQQTVREYISLLHSSMQSFF